MLVVKTLVTDNWIYNNKKKNCDFPEALLKTHGYHVYAI